MSVTEGDTAVGGLFLELEVVDGTISSLGLANDLGNFDNITNVDDLLKEWARVDAADVPKMPAALADIYKPVSAALQGAVSDGNLVPGELYNFCYFLYQKAGIEGISADYATSGVLEAWAIQYGLEAGYLTQSPTSVNAVTGSIPVPLGPPWPGPVTYPNTPPPATPKTAGGHIVKQVIGQTTVVEVSDARLSVDVANAVSAAMQQLYQDLTAMVAQSVDQSLGGLQPGQAKTAINRLNGVTTRIGQDVAGITTELGNPPFSTLQTTLASITAIADNAATVAATTEAQLALQDPSALDTRVNTIGDQVTALTATTTAAEAAFTTRADTFEHQFALTTPSIMSEELATVAGTANTAATEAQAATAMLALTTEECLTALCDGESNVINPITRSGATPSLLSHLGSLLGKVFEVAFIAGLVDGLLTLADWPAAVAGTVWAAEKTSGWAESAALAAMADISWGDTVANG